MTDFSVKIKKLPYVFSYDALDELAAALTIHIGNVVASESQALTDDRSSLSAINPDEIVNVHFA